MLASFAVVCTLFVYLGEFYRVQHPLKGSLEFVLGAAELFGWFVLGDDASRFQLYSAGMPLALLVNGAVFWLLGYALNKIIQR
ncbi:MAG: hypothetical protein C0485_13490 [Pirellula sp.]|nr:hypothetical protein [Pirellula sp.]